MANENSKILTADQEGRTVKTQCKIPIMRECNRYGK